MATVQVCQVCLQGCQAAALKADLLSSEYSAQSGRGEDVSLNAVSAVMIKSKVPEKAAARTKL
jgi:hypothetical protein